jgi:hypothetical protein
MGIKLYKYLILLGFVGVLFLPLLESKYDLLQRLDDRADWYDGERPLDGHFEIPDTAIFSKEVWFSGTFQSEVESFTEYHIGLRPSMVRIHNQIDLDLFGIVHTRDVYVGENNFLFRDSEDYAINGYDFQSAEFIDEKVQKLKFVQDEFEKRGTHVFVTIAPGKAWYHREHIPKDRLKSEVEHTNYDYYKSQFDKYDINYIDMNQWFLDMKDTAFIPLYSKGGIHWTMYGSFVGADSLVRYMEATSGMDIPGLYWDELKAVDKPWKGETDILNAMNILSVGEEFQMYHPQLLYEDYEGRTRPEVLLIGDSYWYFPLWSRVPQNTFSDSSSYWYYFKSKENNNMDQPLPIIDIDDLDLSKEFQGQDFIALLFTATNLNRFAYDFVEESFQLLKGDSISETSISD